MTPILSEMSDVVINLFPMGNHVTNIRKIVLLKDFLDLSIKIYIYVDGKEGYREK
ncbi:hypothetical protein GH754_02145 [Salinibacillus xinjiangensis]|uniref:Uncharacterized protein n=1 Tax=Salinibacillus xinjiangensis TaxID=1229268 RepID=A0A6G1X2F8_9BACI|nr:hypothetical protein [Salinibacillus xinjiangensis]